MENLDDIDIRILNLLQEDSRLSYNKIAMKLRLSVGTVFNHIKNLQKKGVLQGYTVILDWTKLGYSLTALVLVQTEGKHIMEVETEIAKASNVIAVYDVTGDYDAVVVSKFKDRNSLNVFIKGLLAMPFVRRTVTNVAFSAVKEDFRVKL
ncbi:MAG: Lrp/AsnC family transcriptional regulator [Candidatus Bathyarchaeota archaeon]|nr:Lrp/AsnC family transcriptional regulator [Candidatus Bathyarchaeota archaeon]